MRVLLEKEIGHSIVVEVNRDWLAPTELYVGRGVYNFGFGWLC